MANWKITIIIIGKSSKCSWAMSCTYSYVKLPEGIDVYGVFPIKSSIYSGCSTLDPPFIQDSHVEWGDEHPYPLVICYSLRTWTWPSRNSWFTMIYLWKMMFFHCFLPCFWRVIFIHQPQDDHVRHLGVLVSRAQRCGGGAQRVLCRQR